MIDKLTLLMDDAVKLTEPFLQNFDPSLFQNVIIGVLMVLIFVSDQVLSEIKSQKGRGEFSKMVIFYEILNIVYIPIFAVASLTIFSFLKNDLNESGVGFGVKVLTIIFLFSVVVFVFFCPIFKFQLFFRGKRHKLEISFLKHLSFSKILKFKNTVKAEKMVRAWNSFWSEQSELKERDFTQIFVSHIDDAIKYKKFNLAIELSRTYIRNIGKRNVFIVGDKILPEIFEWNEVLWNYEQNEDKSYYKRKKIEKKWQKKYILKFLKEQRLKFFDKKSTKKYDFWNFNYYSREFLPEVVKLLLQDRHGSWQLFDVFKKYIENCERKLKELKSEEKKDYQQFIVNIFNNFCPVFFDEVDSAPSRHDIWHHYFPKEWKITSNNFENISSKIIFDEVIKWSENRLFTEDEKPSFNSGLSDVMSGLFPNVHLELFTAFLKLYSEFDLESALRKRSNFSFIDISISWSGSADVDDDVMNREMDKMMQEKDISQQEDTVQVIFKYFRHKWSKLKIMLDDSNKEEWDKSNEEQKHNMLQNARKKNMSELKKKLESKEIKKVCAKEKYMESNRQSFLGLVNLLLKEVNKNNF